MEPIFFHFTPELWREEVYAHLPAELAQHQPGPELAVKWYNLLGGGIPLPGQPVAFDSSSRNQGFMHGYEQLAAWFEGIVVWLGNLAIHRTEVSFNPRFTDTIVAVLYSLRDVLRDEEALLVVVADLNPFLDEYMTPARVAAKEVENPALDGESEILMDFIIPRRLAGELLQE